LASFFGKVFGAGQADAPLTPMAFRERYQAALERVSPQAEVTVASDEELLVNISATPASWTRLSADTWMPSATR
jgi:hypothetical protein